MSRSRYALGLSCALALFAANAAMAVTENDQQAEKPLTPAPAPTKTPLVDDVKFRCEFAGGVTGAKNETVAIACRAHGRISVDELNDFLFTPGDADDFFEADCGDDARLYRGPVTFGQVPAFIPFRNEESSSDEHRHGPLNAIIAGVKTTSPTLLIEDVRLKHLRHDEVRAAVLTFSRVGIQFTLPGICRLERQRGGSVEVPVPLN